MNTSYPPLLALLLTAGCADDAISPAYTEVAPADAMSPAALAVEQAERQLARGGDPNAALLQLEEALASRGLTADERTRAMVAASRAEERLGRREAAVSRLETALAASAHDDEGPRRDLRSRLRELITGDTDRPPANRRQADAAPFARVLASYFDSRDDGRITVSTLIAGGDEIVSDELGTFDVALGLRAEREAACPLCDVDLEVSSHRHRSDWLLIPAHRQELEDALAVFYFDLERNRIPARYEGALPMSAAAIEARLEAGESFVVARDRGDAPPAILLAAPRTAMLEDVERALSQMDQLPVERVVVDVAPALRPREIQGEMRRRYFPEVRGCYEALLERAPTAAGKVILDLAIEAGRVASIDVDVAEGDVGDGEFLGCLRAAAPDLRFPVIEDRTKVTYPIVVSPD